MTADYGTYHEPYCAASSWDQNSFYSFAGLLHGLESRSKQPEYAQLLADCQRMYCEIRLQLMAGVTQSQISQHAREPPAPADQEWVGSPHAGNLIAMQPQLEFNSSQLLSSPDSLFLCLLPSTRACSPCTLEGRHTESWHAPFSKVQQSKASKD